MTATAVEAGRAVVVSLPDEGAEIIGVVESVESDEIVLVVQPGQQNRLLGAHARVVRMGLEDPLIVDLVIDRVEPVDDEPPRAVLQFGAGTVVPGARSRARVRVDLSLHLLVPDLYRPRTVTARTDWISSSAIALKMTPANIKGVEGGASVVASMQLSNDGVDLFVLERGAVEIAGLTARVTFNIVSADNHARNVLHRVVGDALLASAGLT
jgi:hypothetical protein